MAFRKKAVSLLYFFLVGATFAWTQGYVVVSGYVMDTQGRMVELANVSELQGKHATYTDENGFYSLSFPVCDTIILRYTCLSYQPATRIIPVETNQLRVNVTLGTSSKTLNEIIVRSQQHRTGTFETLDASKIRLLPDASGGSIEALLVTFAGVSSNNELSSQYSVRGGNFDENLVYVNGTEVYRPLLIRAGQQEGMSFINPEMVKEVKFSSGGFDAKYGDKMSSVLDIQYKKPDHFEASANVSLLGANLYVGQASKNGRFTQIHGMRYKTNAYLLGTLQTDAEYHPNFFDYQTSLTYKLSPTLELRFLGNFSQNSYEYIPKENDTDFGTYQKKISLHVEFDGKEKDLFQTSFGALSLNKTLNKQTQIGLQSSVFNTVEDENYDITSYYWLSDIPVSNDQADTENTTLLGTGTFHEHARNHLTATVFNVSHTGTWKSKKQELQWGLSYQREKIQDHLKEWKMLDSAGYSLPYSTSKIQMSYSMRSNVKLESNRVQGYIQDHWRFRKESGLYILTAGLRANYWDLNNDLLLSPRASITFIPAWEKNFTFRLSSGIYYQAPFYKELRDTVTVDGVTTVVLNRNIKAPKSIQIVGGMDYQFIGLDRPFKLTAEAYYKDMRNLIPYTVDNVRIRYCGKNMAKGYTAGLDMKLFGEFVPGTDSWFSLSLMRSHETIDDYTVPRPNEQRYNVSFFFQDYFPNNPKFAMNLKFIWADGLPFGPPNSSRRLATLRLPPYRRVDIGLSRILVGGEDKIMKSGWLKEVKSIWFGVDCFNLLDISNTNSYYWITDITNTQWAIPTYLTKRMLNVRLSAEF
jgi:hypothetical protein